MKRFRFALKPVETLRAQAKLRAREAFAGAVQSMLQARQELAATEARVADVETDIAAGRQGRFSPLAEAETLTAYRHERASEARAQQLLETAGQVMERRRLEYVEAHRQLEVVHRLEATARRNYRLEVGREEQAEYDEFASRRASRRSPYPV